MSLLPTIPFAPIAPFVEETRVLTAWSTQFLIRVSQVITIQIPALQVSVNAAATAAASAQTTATAAQTAASAASAAVAAETARALAAEALRATIANPIFTGAAPVLELFTQAVDDAAAAAAGVAVGQLYANGSAVMQRQA